MEEYCRNCKFMKKDYDAAVLRCHRQPPNHGHAWPIVRDTDWCGEWKPNRGAFRPLETKEGDPNGHA